jgi:predicted Zn-dependent peptidase
MKKVTIADVQRAISKYFLKDSVIFYALPRGQKSFFAGVDNDTIEESEIQRIAVSDRITLLHKHTSEKPIVRVAMHIPSSSDYETATDIDIIWFMTDLMFMGSRKHRSNDLSDWLDVRSIWFQNHVNRNGITIEFSCMADDLADLMDRIIDCLSNPLFSQNDIDLHKAMYNSYYRNMMTNPMNIHREFMNQHRFQNQRDKLTLIERLVIINSFTRDDILRAYRKYITGEKITFAVVGDIDENRARRFASSVASKIPNRAVNAVKVAPEMIVQNSVIINEYQFDQVNITFNAFAPNLLNEREFIIAEVICSIMGFMRGRMFHATRGERDLAYFAQFFYNSNRSGSNFEIVTQTSIDKKDELIEVIKNELNRLRNEPISTEEIEEAVMNTFRIFINLNEEHVVAGTALRREVSGLGFDFRERSLPEMLSVTPEEIMYVANKYLTEFDIIISLPFSQE